MYQNKYGHRNECKTGNERHKVPLQIAEILQLGPVCKELLEHKNSDQNDEVDV